MYIVEGVAAWGDARSWGQCIPVSGASILHGKKKHHTPYYTTWQTAFLKPATNQKTSFISQLCFLRLSSADKFAISVLKLRDAIINVLNVKTQGQPEPIIHRQHPTDPYRTVNTYKIFHIYIMITFCNLKGISVSPFQQLFSVKTTFVFSQLLGSCYIPYLHGACIYMCIHILIIMLTFPHFSDHS